MKKIVTLFTSSTLFLLPMIASAQLTTGSGAGDVQNIFVGLLQFIQNALLPLVLALAFLFFVWGMFVYFIAGGGDEEKRAKGKNILIWSVVAFLFISVIFAVVNLLATSIGVDGDEALDIPDLPTNL